MELHPIGIVKRPPAEQDRAIIQVYDQYLGESRYFFAKTDFNLRFVSLEGVY